MKNIVYAHGGLSSTGSDRRSHAASSFRGHGSTEERMHSKGYTMAIDSITSMMGCTDIRELLKLVPKCFKGVVKIEIDGTRKVSGELVPLFGAFVEKDKVVFTNPMANDEHFVCTEVPLTLKHTHGSRKIGDMRIMSFFPLSLHADSPNDKEETRKVLDILGSLLARTIDAKLDGLTALPIRKYFEDSLEERAAQFQSTGRRFALIILDIDDFKSINDKHGHTTGDAVLSSVARILQNSVRARADCTDSVFRVGGEEFAVLLPDASMQEAHAIAERLRISIKNHAFDIPRKVTCSFGIANAHEPSDAESLPAALYRLADARMYFAKSSGKDMVYPQFEEKARLIA